MTDNKTTRKGRLVVVSGPSGVGKGTVLQRVLEHEDFVYSVSATTREARPGEVDGKNYFFIDREKFEQMIKNHELIEYAEYNGNYYGTPRFFVDDMLSKGKNVILEIEVNGAVQIKKKFPGALFVFIAPENKSVLEKRLHTRATEDEEVIKRRLEIAEREIRSCLMYDYIALNRDGKSDECAYDIISAVRTESLKPLNVYEYISEFFQ